MKEDAVNFLKNLKSKVKIISHRDTDGICALAILLNFLERHGIEEEHEFVEACIDKLELAENMIFLDISLDNISKFITTHTLVIDHHPYSKKIENIVFYNPREIEPQAYIPTSYLIYEVISEIENIEEMRWIAAVGVLGDRGDLNSEFCRDFVNYFKNKDKLELVSKYIFSADLVDHDYGIEKALQIIRKSKTPEEVLNNGYLKSCYEEIQREILNSKKKVEREDNVIFVEVNSRYNLKSIIAHNLLEKYKNIIVIAYSLRDNYYHISGRTNMNINIGKIFSEVAKICGGTGGGHEKAAGARIKKDKLELFKEELLNKINEIGI